MAKSRPNQVRVQTGRFSWQWIDRDKVQWKKVAGRWKAFEIVTALPKSEMYRHFEAEREFLIKALHTNQFASFGGVPEPDAKQVKPTQEERIAKEAERQATRDRLIEF